MTIWKDVPGMFNADPKRFPDTKLLSHISYREAIELSYFGASVIHPRTLQPLQKKHIPLYVRSFADPEAPGSTIDDRSDNDSLIPSFIVKPTQLLISITPRDLSFVVEENLSEIFSVFAARKVRIELMQNSAVAFSVVVDDTPRARGLIEELGRGLRGPLQRRVRAHYRAALRRAHAEEADGRKGRAHRAAQPQYRAVRPEVSRSVVETARGR